MDAPLIVECRRQTNGVRQYVDWVIKQVLFHDMRLTEAHRRMAQMDVPEHVFQRLFKGVRE